LILLQNFTDLFLLYGDLVASSIFPTKRGENILHLNSRDILSRRIQTTKRPKVEQKQKGKREN
jgi:hypothetical protein